MSNQASSQPSVDCLIAGGGLGGMTAAIALRRAGHRVTVIEQAAQLGEVGAGIQTAPNASRLLAEWGVAEALGDAAVESQASNRRRWQDGRLLGSFPQGEALRESVGAPYWLLHRADLHAALVAVATDPEAEGEPVAIELDRRVEAIASEPGAARVTVTASGGESFEGDALIGADGINSVVREQLFGPRSAPYSGELTRRMIISVEAIADVPGIGEVIDEPGLTIWIGPGRHVVLHQVHGTSHVYLGVTAETPEWEPGWSETKPQLGAAVEAWDPRIPALVEAAPEMTTWPLYDDAPIESWVEGRIALLGDACHPMLPFQAQGAAQAMEDGAFLGTALAGAGAAEVPDRLRHYERARLPRASRVQAASRANGPVFHLPDGPEQEARDAELASGSGDFDSYRWLWSAAPDGTPVAAV